MSKTFEIENETPLDYFTKLTEFIYDPQYARYLRRIGQRYQRELIPPEIELMPIFVDALIFDTYIQGKTILDLFIETYRPQMTSSQLRIYQNFKHYLFSSYRVLGHPSADEIELEDLLDQSRLVIRDSEARRQMIPGLHLIARLLPFEGDYVPTGAAVILSYSEPQKIMEITRLLKLPPLMI